MTETTATDRLREEIRAAIRASGVKQIWIAEQLGVSQKHLSQMLTGRVGLPLDWAQRIAALCGHTATVTVQPAADAELRAQLAATVKALGVAETELAALREVACGYCPACGRGDAAAGSYAGRAETAERERDEARQHSAAIAAQRDRLRMRMNALADRWDAALAVDKPYARTLRAEISVAPFEPEASLAVQPYRADDGSQKWAARCWGTETCDGWLSLDHDTERWAEIARDRHIAEDHTAPDDPELTAEEARDLADELGRDLYRAQDRLAFIAELLDAAERDGTTIVEIARVRGWLDGPKCGMQLAAEQPGLYEKLTGLLSGPLPPPGDVPPATVLPCSTAQLRRQAHAPHAWQPQPGMRHVQCPGYTPAPAATEATDT